MCWNILTSYAQPGIGTWFSPGVVSPIFHWGAKLLDEAFAWWDYLIPHYPLLTTDTIGDRYLDAHVIDGYRFLMQNYRVGDKICIFGKWCLWRHTSCVFIDFLKGFLVDPTLPGMGLVPLEWQQLKRNTDSALAGVLYKVCFTYFFADNHDCWVRYCQGRPTPARQWTTDSICL